MTIFVPADALPRHRRPSRNSILEYDENDEEEEEMEHREQDGEDEERQQLRTNDAQQALPSRSRTPSFLSRDISPLLSIVTSESVVSTTIQQPTTSAIPVAVASELSSMHAIIDRLQRPTASFLLPATSTTVALLPVTSATVAACTTSAIPVTVANDWTRVAERCLTHPHEVVDQDRRGRTCLHAAAAKKPPASVIRALLQACRSSSNNNSSRMAIGGEGGSAVAAAVTNNNSNNDDPSDICLERDKHGRTPLTIAICSNASISVVDLLLRANPKAASVHDHLGHLPLHLACGAAAGYGEEEYDDQQVQLVRKLLAAFPEAATRESFNGRTALHAAMEARAPVQVVELLVKANPNAVLNKSCGLNPLFVAIRFNAPVEVIQCLVRANPAALTTRDQGYGLPFHRSIENQSPVSVQKCLANTREIVLDADPLIHNTALHSALDCGSAKETTVDWILQMAPEIATKRNKAGKTPLSLACQKWQRYHHQKQQNQQRRRQRRPDLAVTRLRPNRRATWEQDNLGPSWHMVERLMRAAFYGSRNREKMAGINSDNNNNNNPVLHAAVSLFVPQDVVEQAVSAHRHEARVQDSLGRYPLHLSLLHRPPTDCVLPLSSAQTYLDQKEWTILKMLHLFPEAAYIPQEGTLPLHLAASSSSVSLEVLKELWSVNPCSLFRRDAKLLLYPFQIAALPKAPLPALTYQKATFEWRQMEDLLQLGAIFELLKQTPQLIHAQA